MSRNKILIPIAVLLSLVILALLLWYIHVGNDTERNMIDGELLPQDASLSAEVTTDNLIPTSQAITSGLEEYDGVVYYCQNDEKYKDELYGTDLLSKTACGPTTMAMVISTLSHTTVVDPIEMCRWSVEHGYWMPGGGSYMALLTDAALAYDIPCTVAIATAEVIRTALSEGKLIIVTMGKSIFTNGSHFILLRHMDEEGNIYINDPYRRDFTQQAWELYELMDKFGNGTIRIYG